MRASERVRLAVERAGTAQATFDALLDALLAPGAEGAARLQVLGFELGQGAPTCLALHLVDAFAIGLVRPEAVAVGLHDLPAGDGTHSAVRAVQAWVRGEGHAAYAILPRDRGVVRVLFLPRTEDTGRLLAHLLPFDCADLGGVPAMRLVFQDRGSWVRRIEPLGRQAAKS